MAKAIPYDNRVRIIMRLKEGEKTKDLAMEMGYSQSGIRKLWYNYKKEGTSAYENKYNKCGRKSEYRGLVRKKVKELRDNRQGGCYIYSKLKQKYPELAIPSARTLQRWWVKEGSNRPKGRPGDYEKKVEPDSA